MSFEEEPSTAEPRLGEERLASWRLLAANKVTVVAFVVLVIVVAVALLAPWIAPYGVNEVNVAGALQGPSWAHPFGTDDLRSEEHTSELQSRGHLVCRLLLEQKNTSMYLMLRFCSG